jgi:twitching motility two-component system response regulator PilH
MATDPQSGQSQDKGSNASSGSNLKRAWVVGGALESWWSLGWALHQLGTELRPVAPDADLAQLSLEAERQQGVVVIDFAGGEERALATLSRCRGASASLALVAVTPTTSLDLTTRARGAGANIVVSHPLDAPKVQAAIEDALRAAAPGQTPARDRRRILVIDDDRDYRDSIVALLQSQGYDVCCAASGAEGLQKAMAEKPDLIVLDVMMENEWIGYEVSQTLKHKSGYESVRAIPILMVSSIQEHPADRFARSDSPDMASPDSYLTKPIDIPAFLESVRALLSLTPSPGHCSSSSSSSSPAH